MLHLVSIKCCRLFLLKQLTDKIISVPQLDVHLIGARHLPSSFGLKTVEGYVVKVVRSKSSMQSRGKYFTISSRWSFSPDQQSSTRPSKHLHGQSLMKHFDFQWHHCTSNTLSAFSHVKFTLSYRTPAAFSFQIVIEIKTAWLQPRYQWQRVAPGKSI